MFRWLHALLMFGLLVGTGMRASGAHFDLCPPSAHAEKCCDGEKAKPADCADCTDHGPECPPNPHHHEHHHGSCCLPPVWMPSQMDAPSLFPPSWQDMGAARTGSYPPDGPVLSLDKPPLI